MPIYTIDKDEKLIPIKQVKFNNEKEMQNLTENNLEELFDLRFVASEFQVDNLRIDTLAFNEKTKSFVIIFCIDSSNSIVILLNIFSLKKPFEIILILLNLGNVFMITSKHSIISGFRKGSPPFTPTLST